MLLLGFRVAQFARYMCNNAVMENQIERPTALPFHPSNMKKPH